MKANKKTLSPEQQLEKIKTSTVDLVSEKELLNKLKNSVKKNRPLKIKAGFDPSRPDLHFGHLVLLKKLKTFQDIGHEVIFLIGDFTALIGDPSGRDKTRPLLEAKTVKENAKTYSAQVFKILDKKKTKIMFNSRWMDKMHLREFIKLLSSSTVSRILEREDFTRRIKKNLSIGLHEFIYPLVQAYDSVVLKADVELGAGDQLFNLLTARDLQKKFGQESQCVVTLPLLEGTDGVQKMSKSFNNYIALKDSPKNMFGKIMSLNDDLMLKYYELLTDKTDEEFSFLKKQIQSKKIHPKKAKEDLAFYFVNLFYGEKEAKKALEEFEKVFSKKEKPSDIKEYKIKAGQDKGLAYLLKEAGLTTSTSEAGRLIKGGGVKIDHQKITDYNFVLNLKVGESRLIKSGKRNFIKIKAVK